QHRRRGAEGDDVGDGVVLLAELARRAEGPGQETVERVENRGDEQRQAGRLERLDGQVVAPVGDGRDGARAGDDGPGAEEDVQHRQQRGDDVYAAAEVRRLHAGSPIWAITVRPTFTFSRMLTFSCASGGKKMSTREPNLIIPTRSPRTTSWPSFL